VNTTITTNGSSSNSGSSTNSGSTSTNGAPSSGATNGSTTGSGSQSSSGTSSTTQTVNNTAGSATDAAVLADLKQQLADAQVIYNQLAGVMSTAQLSNLDTQQKAYAQVLDPAIKPPTNTTLLAAFTVLLGLLVGVGAIFAWDYFDNALHSRTTLEDIFGETAVVQVAGRPSRHELRNVAAGIWALPAPTQSQQRPGQWPGALVVSTLASLASKRSASDGANAATTSADHDTQPDSDH